ncbi:MAG: carboxypeptidase-like regulatory domain-containing protein [Flavobacteriaceae bacterium]
MKAQPTKKIVSRTKLGWCLVLLNMGALWSQDFKEIQGRVVHDSLSLSGIHILNKTKGTATITDASGNFSIAVSPGDTLFFSGIQFAAKVLPITPSLLEATVIQVYLEPFINQLDEVVVTNHKLSGNLIQDVKSNSIQQPVNFYSLGIPGYGGKREEKIISGKSLLLSTLLLPLSGGLNVEAIYKHFSGYYKNLKKKRQLDAQFESSYQLIRFYGVQFLMDRYDLPEDRVYEFVTGVQENYPIDLAFEQGRHAEVLRFFETYVGVYQATDKNYVEQNEKN